jgi:chromosome segregation ATPase
MSDKNTMLIVEIAEAQMNDVLDKHKDTITSDLKNSIQSQASTVSDLAKTIENVQYDSSEVKDSFDNLEYEVEEFKDSVNYLESDIESKYKDLKGDYNDLDDRLSELESFNKDSNNVEQKDMTDYVELNKRLTELEFINKLLTNKIDGFEEHFDNFKDQLTAIDKQCAEMEKNSLEKIKLITDIAVNFERLAKNIYK